MMPIMYSAYKLSRKICTMLNSWGVIRIRKGEKQSGSRTSEEISTVCVCPALSIFLLNCLTIGFFFIKYINRRDIGEKMVKQNGCLTIA